MTVSLEDRLLQNLAAPRADTRSVTPSIRAFAQAIDRQRAGLERVPLLAGARPDLATAARRLEEAEVAALAVELDDPQIELGAVSEVARASAVPLLRTDLLLEEFQIYQSRAAGFDAVLLVAAHLPDPVLARLCSAARSTHMAACVACATAVEIARAAQARADVIALPAAPAIAAELLAALPRRALILALTSGAPEPKHLLGRADAALDRALGATADPAAAFRAALAEED
jgi:hypothetical protein